LPKEISFVVPGEALMVGLEPDFRSPPRLSTERKRRPAISWRQSLHNAHKGFKLGVRGHERFFRHFFFAALALAAATVLRCSPVEWSCLVTCVALILITELVNSAFECICQGLEEPLQSKIKPALYISGAAVLLASIVAVLIAAIVFLDHLMLLFS
jgi:diacylglycerol kinase